VRNHHRGSDRGGDESELACRESEKPLELLKVMEPSTTLTWRPGLKAAAPGLGSAGVADDVIVIVALLDRSV
jgi:hypothetical protein